jgi:hypothetical protein
MYMVKFVGRTQIKLCFKRHDGMTENNYKVRPNRYKVITHTTILIKNVNIITIRFVELNDQTRRIQRLD